MTKRTTDTGETPENRRARAALDDLTQALAPALKQVLPSGLGFTLMLYQFERDGRQLAWISNASPEDMRRALDEFRARLDARMAGERTPPTNGETS
jgi:hypothetical protein